MKLGASHLGTFQTPKQYYLNFCAIVWFNIKTWKNKTRVTSSNIRVTSSNPQFTSSNPQATSSNSRVTSIHELQVQIHELGD